VVPEVRYSLGKRALLLVVGVLMTASGLAVLLVFIGLLTHELLDQHVAEAVVMAAVGSLIAGGLSTMGVRRVRAGMRGSHAAGTPHPFARTESWYRRNWYAAGLSFWALWVLGALLFKGPDAVFVAKGYTAARIGWYAFLCYALLPVHVTLHELGHAAAGAILGFRFVSVRVGWLTIQRDAAGYGVSWARPKFSDLLGLHVALPDDSRMLRVRTAARAAAGPLTTLLVALAFRAAAAAVSSTPGLPDVAGQALWIAWWMGLVLAVMNVVPFRTPSGFLNDGAIVAQSLAPMSRPARALYTFGVKWSLGHRPRDWGIPASEFVMAADHPGADRDALLLAAASISLDTGNDLQAAQILARALEAPSSAPSSMRRELELHAAMLAAFEGRVAEARERIARAGPVEGFPAYSRLAEAVVSACEGAPDAAASAVEEWELALERTGRAPSIRVGNDWAVERLRLLLAK
jgi:hypothetical protein